ncbi:hypothetical protein [Nocardioides zeicaulis]|uniref:Uncharacterized protein n=1 Tax=Nocardioides zeicaulis TaxID=1776857 RepID=A0ABV6E4U3_9ACTN
MPRQVVVIVIPVLFMLLVGVVAYASRRSLTSRLYPGAGLDDWRRVAAGLSWRDRWAVSRANATGREAPPRLAPHAVRRGEVMIACIGSWSDRRSPLRKTWRGLGLLFALLCALSIALVASGEREWHNWLQVVTQGSLAVMSLTTPALQRRQLPKLRRSVERNRALVAAQV